MWIYSYCTETLSKPVEYIIPILQDFIKQGKTRFIGVATGRVKKGRAQAFIASGGAAFGIAMLFFLSRIDPDD